MRTARGKEPQSRKPRQPVQSTEGGLSGQTPVHYPPVSPCDDLQVRIAKRAYELHAERGYREGYALDDWLEAEREILGSEFNA